VVALDRQVLGVRNLLESLLMAAGRDVADAHQSGGGAPVPMSDRPLILLVEDNPMNQVVVQRQLEMLGFQVAVAPDGEAGLSLWRQLHPALILTDLHMPVMDGYAMVKRILSGGDVEVPPIVALTADASSEERNKCLAAGMSGYVTKPVRAQALKAVLDKWIASGPRRTAAPVEHEARNVGLQLQVLEEVAGHDPKLINALLETFTTMADDTVKVMRSAVAAEDATALGEEAHKFKSSARTIGALRLANLCEALERDRNRYDAAEAAAAVDRVCEELKRVLAEVAARLEDGMEAVA
jgi:CheY-like chemotaxis protein/HPt (histidine-containing phosphotransfer) domain-containing protein